ncbi:hypothetical protein C8F04DRAFT_1265221 [Mycena alexandri]|uniref:Uncharacterized protein n=1 Tax=Mycena alexandri TaxID=1745969 RepID=A0AAD6SJH1_9AGAR|nr:hypothetical protein C8F04DRAFT_1265221 [Mycena alexandri]
MTRYCCPQAAPRARLIVLHALRTHSLADIRRLRDPHAQALALLRGPNPYINDGDGFVYVHARVKTSTWNDFLAGNISWPTVLAELEIKAGHTNDLERRLGEYKSTNATRALGASGAAPAGRETGTVGGKDHSFLLVEDGGD